MDLTTLLFGILPLVAFVIVDSFAGLKTGLIVAVVVASFEVGYSIYILGELDNITFFSVFLVAVMAVMAYWKNSETIFLMQPVIFSGCISAYLLISYAFDHAVFKEFIIKFRDPLNQMVSKMSSGQQKEFSMMIVNGPFGELMADRLSLTLGIGLIFHAFLCYVAATQWNKWGWIVARGVGFYGISFICSFISVFLARSALVMPQ